MRHYAVDSQYLYKESDTEFIDLTGYAHLTYIS
jgi:hypothetical protein